MSWQEAFLNKFNFNALLAAVGTVGAFLWFIVGSQLSGIIALVIAVYFFFLLIACFISNYKHNVALEREKREKTRYEIEQQQLVRAKIEIWYAGANSYVRNDLRKLLTFDYVSNDPCTRVCRRERGEYFNYDSFTYQFPGTDLFRPECVVNRIDTHNGNDVY